MSDTKKSAVAPRRGPSPYQIEQAMSVLSSTAAMLREADPEIATDQKLLLDMLEGEGGDAMEVLDRVIRASIEANVFAKAAKERSDAIADRATRYKARADALRGCAFAALSALDISKLERPDFTASIRAGQQSAFITDETLIPDGFMRVVKSPNKSAITEALKAGTDVSGAELRNGAPSLTVRVS